MPTTVALMDAMREHDSPMLEAYDDLVIALSTSGQPGDFEVTMSGLMEAAEHGAFPLLPAPPASTVGGGIS